MVRGRYGAFAEAEGENLPQRARKKGENQGMTKYERGDYIKFEMKDDKTGECEWLWMCVETCDDANRFVFGKLDSQPVIVPGELKLGQELAVSFDNIRDHKKPSDF